ncbi:hypothetical protein K0M31_017867 [Melipona bicolor]|uniref:Uncharacterized protein n=1 Tax=Melipona bicolor TaxID=60889 RepID=A0AA40G632_9HYME|nr:hypothetical protein K0M31_017867 [Melipona bicolor]
METIFAGEVVSEMAATRDGDKECGAWNEQRGREKEVHSTFWRNDDASNMSPTDIPVGIPESANYRPEAHATGLGKRLSPPVKTPGVGSGVARRDFWLFLAYAAQRPAQWAGCFYFLRPFVGVFPPLVIASLEIR